VRKSKKMKIAFCYPPFSQDGRFPNLPQNRQFIYTASGEVRIYPVVMATAASWLRRMGHEILWLDGVTRRLNWESYQENLLSFSPDILVLETKAPLIKNIWKYLDEVKFQMPGTKCVLVGDHVSYFPEESFRNSKVDFILTGGDYDFLLVNLANYLDKRVEKMEPGIWYRGNSKSKSPVLNSGEFRLDHGLDETPTIDRELTCWKDYGEAYLYHPCAYVMFGRGCGIRKGSFGVCNFCIWQQAFWRCSARLRTPSHVVFEIKNLVSLGAKEIFDDTESGALWDYHWLEEFYRLLKREKILDKVVFSSNARGDQLNKKTCSLLRKIGYRLLKVGLESGSNKTLKLIGKKEKVEEIISGVKNAKDNGLRVMLTVMVGYPWEEEKDVRKTYEVTKRLMFYKTRAGDCLQASLIIPYPGTPLWWMAKRNGWFLVDPDDYEKFDMSQPVIKTKIDAQFWCRRIWAIQKNFQFILRSGLTIRNVNEIPLLLRGAKSLLGHLKDYA